MNTAEILTSREDLGVLGHFNLGWKQCNNKLIKVDKLHKNRLILNKILRKDRIYNRKALAKGRR